MHLLEQVKEFASLSLRPVLLSNISLYALLARNAKDHKWNQLVVGFFLFAVPALVGLCWQAAVALNVPEPYLVSWTGHRGVDEPSLLRHIGRGISHTPSPEILPGQVV